MKHVLFTARHSLMLLVITLGLTAPALQAQTVFPERPVQVVVPYPAGGSLDSVIRPLGEAFAKVTGQPIVIDNVGGAGGLVGAAKVVQARPDGYTLLLASNGQVSIAPLLYPDMKYDPQKDLLPIIHLVDQTAVLYAGGNSPFKTLADVLKAARAKAGGLDMASSGKGSISHLAMELLAQKTGVKFNHIPYRGAVPALQDLVSGQVPLLFTFVGSARQLTASGLVRPIAVASARRLPGLPDVPTFAELGYPDMLASVWIGLMAPAGTPKDVMARMATLVEGIVRQAEFTDKMGANSAEVKGGTPQDFSSMIQADTARWSALAKTANLAGN